MIRFQTSLVALFLVVGSTFALELSATERSVLCFILVLLYAIVIVIVSMNIKWNFFLKAIHHMADKKIMLTFDDGPHQDNTPKILDILKSHQVKAMFFLIGKNVASHPDIVKRIVNEGHAVGGHSFSHKIWFGALLGGKLRTEIMQGQQAISEITKKKVKWFRPPFGVTNPKIAKCVQKEKLQVIGWDVRSFDSAIKDPIKLKERIKNKIKPGSIVLLHDPLPQTAAVLDQLITSTKEKGYEFGILEE